ncbi:MAG: DNA-3-methyladenine glycosylase I [Acidimicrobiia bacterium]|nr:DNA-3-methyladenine glycosylase I [Acidimicrobiia bacterium]
MNVGVDGVTRCSWGNGTSDYLSYHDDEWGRPVDDDNRLFEKLSLEGFQSGLAWITILRKRPAFRDAFDQFDIMKVARYGEVDVTRMLGDAGIVRHQGKIRSTINNARRSLEVVDEYGSLGALIWSFEPESRPPTWDATTPESVALAKDLKSRGFSFVGPTTAYAFMQAMGLVNDHVLGCAVRDAVEAERTAFNRPVGSRSGDQ